MAISGNVLFFKRCNDREKHKIKVKSKIMAGSRVITNQPGR